MLRWVATAILNMSNKGTRNRNRHRYQGRITSFLFDFDPDSDFDPDAENHIENCWGGKEKVLQETLWEVVRDSCICGVRLGKWEFCLR